MLRKLCCCAALIVIAGGSARAITLVPAEFSAMAQASQIIVRGTVVHARAQVRGDRRAIETLVTVDVAETLKGIEQPSVTFRVPGGQVGRYRSVVPGVPTFRDGDEVVIFLRGAPPAVPMPYGVSQGVYRVRRDGGRAVVTPMVPSAAGRVVRGDPARQPVTVEAFIHSVRSALEPR